MDKMWQAGAIFSGIVAFICFAMALFWFGLASFAKDPKVREAANKHLIGVCGSLILIAVVLGLFSSTLVYISTQGGKLAWVADAPVDLAKWVWDIFMSEGIQVAPLIPEPTAIPDR